MPLTFHEADTLFRQDKLNELVADSEGRRFLKLRSLNRTEYLERLFRMADIPRPDVGARQLFEVAFDADIDVTVIEACARGIYNEERERRRANEAELVNQLYHHGGAVKMPTTKIEEPEDLYTGKMQKVPTLILEGDALHRKKLPIPNQRTCQCPSTHINCMTAKDWLKSQLGVWQFFYEGRDIRNKNLHPATFPIALSKKVIELFTHEGELVLDPFVGSGTTLVAASDLNRNAVGFDLQKHYLDLCVGRLSQNCNMFNHAIQIAIQDDARHVSDYFANDSISLIWTSPPYANLLNRKRKNKSRRDRNNDQLGKVEQYSQDDRDLGILELSSYSEAMGEIFQKLLPLLKPKGHCVINVPDMWWENKRITIHIALVEELRKRGYELRNIIIWDRTNIVNQIGIFGWPSNYITMGVTFEYLLDFWRPPNND